MLSKNSVIPIIMAIIRLITTAIKSVCGIKRKNYSIRRNPVREHKEKMSKPLKISFAVLD